MTPAADGDEIERRRKQCARDLGCEDALPTEAPRRAGDVQSPLALKVLHTSQGQVRRRSTSLVAAAEYVGCWNNTWLLAAVGPANNTSLLAAIPAWWKKPSPVAQMATVPCQAWAVA